MLNLGQSAAALEAHIEATNKEQRDKTARLSPPRVALLIDSMNSARNRRRQDPLRRDRRQGPGIPTSRAIAASSPAARSGFWAEAKPLDPRLYDEDVEFQRAVNRYVHDFEAMLMRVPRRGAFRADDFAVERLMSSDMGKIVRGARRSH
jgi:hypothetical protein